MTLRRLMPVYLSLMLGTSCAVPSSKQSEEKAAPPMTPLQRGEYIATIGGCNDCHTPGAFYGKADFTRRLSGSELGWRGPWGISYARNLTPDGETGLGTWTNIEIERALRSGVRKDGSAILPPMPWNETAALTPDDMSSLIAYLKSLPPVHHKVPDRLPPNGMPTTPTVEIPAPPAWDVPKPSAP